MRIYIGNASPTLWVGHKWKSRLPRVEWFILVGLLVKDSPVLFEYMKGKTAWLIDLLIAMWRSLVDYCCYYLLLIRKVCNGFGYLFSVKVHWKFEKRSFPLFTTGKVLLPTKSFVKIGIKIFCYNNKMFSSINKTFGCCSKIFGCSNKKLFVVPNFVAVTEPFFPCCVPVSLILAGRRTTSALQIWFLMPRKWCGLFLCV